VEEREGYKRKEARKQRKQRRGVWGGKRQGREVRRGFQKTSTQ
jgi:hypothetical protein